MNYDKLRVKMAQAGLSTAQQDEAIRHFEFAESVQRARSYFSRRAPFVMWGVCRKLPWEAEHLPDEYWQYDNNVSINGDRTPCIRESGEPWTGNYGICAPTVPLEDHCLMWDEETQSDRWQPTKRLAYYVGAKLHPRHWFARYVWLGLRNRASYYAQHNGASITDRDLDNDTRVYGDLEIGKDKDGVFMIRCGGAWQYREFKRRGPFVFWKNIGSKINIPLADRSVGDIRPDGSRSYKLMAVHTTFAFKVSLSGWSKWEKLRSFFKK